jgi:hypothetical protein
MRGTLSGMTNLDMPRRSPTFSLVSILAIVFAVLSFRVHSILGGMLLAVGAILLGALGALLAILPGKRGGIISIISILAGVIGILVALFKLIGAAV